MIHMLGYLGLVLNLLSMTMKNLFALRVLSASANLIYIIYGILLGAPPVIIGCTIAVAIHGYHIVKLTQQKKAETQ